MQCALNLTILALKTGVVAGMTCVWVRDISGLKCLTPRRKCIQRFCRFYFHSSATFQGTVSVCLCGDGRQLPIKIKKFGLFSSVWFLIYSKTWHLQSSACSFISVTPNNVLHQKAPNLKSCQAIIYNGDIFHPC